MKQEKRTFNDFVSGDGLLNFCLSVGVFLLIVTYGGIMHRINPNPVAFGYDVAVSVIEALFFGLATFLVIRQAQKQYIKAAYASFEGVAIFLYYNSPYFGEWANFMLTTYISIFAAFTFYSLGYISLFRYNEQQKERAKNERKNEREEQRSNTILDKSGTPFLFSNEHKKPIIGFVNSSKNEHDTQKPIEHAQNSDLNAGMNKNEQVMYLIEQGYTYRSISEKLGISTGAISRIKNSK
jgi:hypothetical protein